MELVEITQQIYKVSRKLDAMPEKLAEYARAYAKAEAEYRMELSKEIYRLRDEGLPATLIPDIARGNLTQLKYTRDLKEAEWRAVIESSKVLMAEASALQSVLRVQEDV